MLMTREAGNSLFFSTLAFLGLPFLLKSARVPPQNIPESESELVGRTGQTWDTAGNLTDMLDQSITQISEIKFNISLKRKKIALRKSS